MARKVFLILAISLLIGLLVEQTAADEGVMLSELADDSGGPDDLVYYEADSTRMKRGARRQKLRTWGQKTKPILVKTGEVAGQVATEVGRVALEAAPDLILASMQGYYNNMDFTGGPDDRVYYEADYRVKRQARRQRIKQKIEVAKPKIKAKIEVAKPGLKKVGKVVGKVALEAAPVIIGATLG